MDRPRDQRFSPSRFRAVIQPRAGRCSSPRATSRLERLHPPRCARRGAESSRADPGANGGGLVGGWVAAGLAAALPWSQAARAAPAQSGFRAGRRALGAPGSHRRPVSVALDRGHDRVLRRMMITGQARPLLGDLRQRSSRVPRFGHHQPSEHEVALAPRRPSAISVNQGWRSHAPCSPRASSAWVRGEDGAVVSADENGASHGSGISVVLGRPLGAIKERRNRGTRCAPRPNRRRSTVVIRDDPCYTAARPRPCRLAPSNTKASKQVLRDVRGEFARPSSINLPT